MVTRILRILRMPKKYFTKRYISFVAVCVVCVLLILINPQSVFSPMRNIVFRAAYPFQKSFYLLGNMLHSTFDFLGSIGELKKENEGLRKENYALAAEIALLRDVKKENNSLREQIGLVPRDTFNLAASFVIARNPQRPGSWILIDKGSSDGVKSGMAVIAYEGILIGRVEDVESHSAKVILVSDSGSVINAVDLETGAKGIIRGEYGLGSVMDMVSQSETLNAGDMVVTSGLGSDMPKGLLIGKIKEVRPSRDELFQQAFISPRIKYSDVPVVFVVKN